MRIPKSVCLNCGTKVDAVTGVPDDKTPPSPGDITICGYCHHMHAFADDLTLRQLTDKEIYEVAGDKKVLWAQHLLGIAKRELNK